MNEQDASGAKKSEGVDWAEIRKRIEDVSAMFEEGRAVDPVEKKRILRERAAKLAHETQAPETGEQIEVIEFLLAHEKYAVESSYVREVFPMKDLTPVPCTPSFVLGIINVRGRILSVIDLKKFFGLPEKGLGELNKVIILKSENMEFGILADVITGVRSVLLSKLQRTMPTLKGVGEEYLKGVTVDREIILDAGKLMSDKGIVVNEEV